MEERIGSLIDHMHTSKILHLNHLTLTAYQDENSYCSEGMTHLSLNQITSVERGDYIFLRKTISTTLLHFDALKV